MRRSNTLSSLFVSLKYFVVARRSMKLLQTPTTITAVTAVIATKHTYKLYTHAHAQHFLHTIRLSLHRGAESLCFAISFHPNPLGWLMCFYLCLARFLVLLLVAFCFALPLSLAWLCLWFSWWALAVVLRTLPYVLFIQLTNLFAVVLACPSVIAYVKIMLFQCEMTGHKMCSCHADTACPATPCSRARTAQLRNLCDLLNFKLIFKLKTSGTDLTARAVAHFHISIALRCRAV